MERKMDIFRERRARFLERMGAGVAIIPTNPVRNRSGNVDYRFRPDSEFYYLTGFAEQEAVAIIAPGHKDGDFQLAVRPRDPDAEVWSGWRVGVEGAVQDFGAVKAHSMNDLGQVLGQVLANQDRIYYRMGRHAELDALILSTIRRLNAMNRSGVWGPGTFVDPGTILNEMRLRKTPGDLHLLRHAVAVSAEGHLAAMRAVRPGLFEYELEALIEYTFRKSGCSGPGYPSIVGSGINACCLHYIDNTRQMLAGELLLVDAGAEYDYFSGDITRTYPVGGRFTRAQAAVYDVVLSAQLAAIAKIRPGACFQDVHDTAVYGLTDGLRSLGILNGSVSDLIKDEAYNPYYMHRTSHWLGMDVHDTGYYRPGGVWRTLEPGMVLTVEPGLYFGPGTAVPAEYSGIGVRIEDDVLVTETGHEVLTAAVPKTIPDLESIIGTK